MRAAKIQLLGQFSIDRRRDEPLVLQIVLQVQNAIERGLVSRGATLPSSRVLARALGVSRNTVLMAYDELKARGLIVRMMGSYSLPHCLRITVGTAEECGMVLDALTAFMRSADA